VSTASPPSYLLVEPSKTSSANALEIGMPENHASLQVIKRSTRRMVCGFIVVSRKKATRFGENRKDAHGSDLENRLKRTVVVIRRMVRSSLA
jgi:hypothetical protein